MEDLRRQSVSTCFIFIAVPIFVKTRLALGSGQAVQIYFHKLTRQKAVGFFSLTSHYHHVYWSGGEASGRLEFGGKNA